MPIQLRKAREADKPYLLALRKLTMTEHLESSGVFLSDADHQHRMEHNFAHAQLIIFPDKNNAIVGAAQFVEQSDNIELLQLQIHPDFQNLGLGTSAVKYLITLAKAQEKQMKLKVLKTNMAKYLYERLGFIHIGEDEIEFYMQYQEPWIINTWIATMLGIQAHSYYPKAK